MDSKNFLKLNPHKAIRYLGPMLSRASEKRIRRELHANVKALVLLSKTHLRFARRATGRGSWRQKVSRGYYACYIASRAVRLAHDGTYDTDHKDHKNISKLPDDFPSRATWAEFLTKFRGDRNLADYDHSAAALSLELRADDYVREASSFLNEVRQHLQSKGVLP